MHSTTQHSKSLLLVVFTHTNLIGSGLGGDVEHIRHRCDEPVQCDEAKPLGDVPVVINNNIHKKYVKIRLSTTSETFRNTINLQQTTSARLTLCNTMGSKIHTSQTNTKIKTRQAQTHHEMLLWYSAVEMIRTLPIEVE